MKFCIEEQDKSTTIKNYKIFGDSIVITFLDNSTCTIDLDEENLHNLIDLMMEQADYRNTFSDVHEFNVSAYLSSYLTGITFGLSFFTSLGFLENFLNDNKSQYIYAAATVSLFALAVLGLKSAYEEFDRAEELEKYKIFLELYKRQLIDIYEDDLSINNLDMYSLQDVKKYQKSLYKKQIGFNK